MTTERSVLAKPAIIEAVNAGHIFISNFDERQVNNCSYDVRLGSMFFEEQPAMGFSLLDPYNEQTVKDMWGEPKKAQVPGEAFPVKRGVEKGLIVLPPGAFFLCHTEEFIGCTDLFNTTMIKARSTTGRIGIQIAACLDPDTSVRKADGTTVRIGDIKVGDRLINVDKDGNQKMADVRAVRVGPPKRTLTIKTRAGRIVTASEDHLFRVCDTTGVAIKEAGQIQVGACLPVLAQWEPETVSDVSIEEAKMLGYFVAEGHWSKYHLYFAKVAEKEAQRDDIVSSMKHVFGVEPSASRDRGIEYNSVDLCRKFQARYPECSHKAEGKRIPASLFTAPLPVVKEFLAAYLRCDGHVRKKRIEVQTVSRSPALIQDLALLAARLGAVPRFNQRRSGAADNMHSYGMYYGNEALKLLGKEETCSRGRLVNVKELLREVVDKYDIGQRAKLLEKESMSPSRIKKLLGAAEIPELKPVLTKSLFWDEVVEVHSSPILRSDLIDISLEVPSEEDSLFCLGNGLMTLNCAGWGDIGYANRWTLEVKNNSKYRSSVLRVGQRIGQIVFMPTTGISEEDLYYKKGKYQASALHSFSHDQLDSEWSPYTMLPKAWEDWDADELVGTGPVETLPRPQLPRDLMQGMKKAVQP